ncbi:MAG TPA: ATP-binding cassette domain-containing protein [Caulobacteraceae bacterium]
MSTSAETAPRAEPGPSAQPAARFDAVAFRRGAHQQVLRGASFTLAPGTFHLLVGPEGSGKTSILRLLCLAERPTAGLVQVFGRDVATLSRRETELTRRRIGAALEPQVFLDHLTVWDNAALGPRIVGRQPGDYEGEVDAVLKWLGLAKLADAAPKKLSPSERYRLAIARAVVNRPEMVLVDEPATGLDQAARARALKCLWELHGAGVTIVMASRDEALAKASHLPALRLQDGRATLVEPHGR